MRNLRRLLLKEFLPFLFMGVFFFVLILILADVFMNLWRYLNREVPFSQALLVSLLYGPKAFIFALPIGSMFAAAFALGNLGARNELISVFGAGVPLWRFILPILFIAGITSVLSFVFEDRLAIPMMRKRNQISNELLGVQDSKNRSRAAVIAREGRVIYYADYYNDEKASLTNPTIIILDENGEFDRRIDAQQGIWDGSGTWLFESCRIFRAQDEGEIIQEYIDSYREEWIDEAPATFRLDNRKLDEMNGSEARQWIITQKRAGLPYKSFQAEYYQRYTMALTPFLVVFFAGTLGGRFRRNILLMSLIGSLGLSSAWYIVRMIVTLLSKYGLISPLLGAVLPYLGFLALGIWLFRYAKT